MLRLSGGINLISGGELPFPRISSALFGIANPEQRTVYLPPIVRKTVLLYKQLAVRTIQLNIPDNVDLRDYELSMIIAAKLYEEAKLSAGQAAEMVGLSKRAFIEMLGKYGVSVFSTSISDLQSDIANA